MSLYEYVAVNNSNGANTLLENYGFKATDNLNTLIDRLKIIVRKYKKTALQDISEIHPDKSLLSSFTKTEIHEKDFAYATGRTPAFEEPIVETPSNFEENKPHPFDAEKVVAEIKDVKKQILKDKANRNRAELNRRMMNLNQAGMGNSAILMLAVGFAIGYVIGKK